MNFSVLVFLFFTSCVLIPDSSEKLVKTFLSHKADFDILNKELLDLKSKGLLRIDEDWTDPQDLNSIGIKHQTVVHLRTKFETLGIKRGISCYENGIEYLVYANGISVSGNSKGYYYSKLEPENFAKMEIRKKPFLLLEKKEIPATGSYTVYSKLAANWYLMESYED